MSTELQLTQQEEIIVKNWQGWGLKAWKSEQHWANLSRALVQTTKMPKTISEIPDAEKELAHIKATIKEISEARIAEESIIQQVFKRRKQPETDLAELKTKLEAAIIPIKSAEAKEKQKQQERLLFLQQQRAYFEKALQDHLILCERVKNGLIEKALSYALDKDIKDREEVRKYIDIVCGKVTVDKFTAVIPVSDDVDILAIINEVWVYNPEDWAEKTRNELREEFSDYGIKYNNKEAAKAALATKIAQENELAVSEGQQAQTAAEIRSSVSIPIQVTGKELKKVYKIDMEETEPNAWVIIQAFAANKSIMKTTVKKFFNLSVSNMITSLEKARNEDNNFAPAGIIYKEIEKL